MNFAGGRPRGPREPGPRAPTFAGHGHKLAFSLWNRQLETVAFLEAQKHTRGSEAGAQVATAAGRAPPARSRPRASRRASSAWRARRSAPRPRWRTPTNRAPARSPASRATACRWRATKATMAPGCARVLPRQSGGGRKTALHCRTPSHRAAEAVLISPRCCVAEASRTARRPPSASATGPSARSSAPSPEVPNPPTPRQRIRTRDPVGSAAIHHPPETPAHHLRTAVA